MVEKCQNASKTVFLLSMILQNNALWLEGDSKTDIDLPSESQHSKMLGGRAYIKMNGVKLVNEARGGSTSSS